MSSIKPKNGFLRARIGKLKIETARKRQFISTVKDIRSAIDLPMGNKDMSRDKMIATEAKLYRLKTTRGMSQSSHFSGDALNFKHEILKLQNIEKLEMTFLTSQQKIHDNISKIRGKVYNKKPFDATKVEELRSNVQKLNQTYKGVAQRIERSMKFALPMRIEQEGKKIQKMRKTFLESIGHRRSKSERVFKPAYLEKKYRLGKMSILDFRVK